MRVDVTASRSATWWRADLAHKASHERVCKAIMGHKVAFDPQAIPAVVFTDPEVGAASPRRKRRTRKGRDRCSWARRPCHYYRSPDGMTKLVTIGHAHPSVGTVGAGRRKSPKACTPSKWPARLGSETHHPPASRCRKTLINGGSIFSTPRVYRPKKVGSRRAGHSPRSDSSAARQVASRGVFTRINHQEHADHRLRRPEDHHRESNAAARHLKADIWCFAVSRLPCRRIGRQQPAVRNHACRPAVTAGDRRGHRIRAARNIRAGEELTYRYIRTALPACGAAADRAAARYFNAGAQYCWTRFQRS